MRQFSSSVIIATAILSFICGFIIGGTEDDFITFMKDWETLVAASLALFGAALTIHEMQSKRNEERKSKQRAALFPLADSLNSVCDYAQDAMTLLMSKSETKNTLPAQIPEITIQNLREITEYYEGDISEATGRIGPKYQLCKARFKSIQEAPTSSMRNDVICDYAELYILASRLLDFSRTEKEATTLEKITLSEICNAFRIKRCNFYWPEIPNNRKWLEEIYQD